MQEHFSGSMERVGLELIKKRKGERGNIKAVKPPYQRHITPVLCLALLLHRERTNSFTACAKQLAAINLLKKQYST